MDQELIQLIILDILKNIPNKPFFCLPLSAFLYATLKDNYNVHSKILTGNLSFKNHFIFKQDFSINAAQPNTMQHWAGHAWVELNDVVYDLSFFRTLYSNAFTKDYKFELIKTFGMGRGCLIGAKSELKKLGLTYISVDELNDLMATRILNGFANLL